MMKKYFPKVALLLLLVWAATSLSAQIALGIRGGVNMASWSLNDVAKNELAFDPKSANSLLFGALLEVRLTDNLAIQPEINYIQKGTKIDETTLAVKTSGRYTFNYLEVPLLLKVGTGFGVGRFDFLLGPSFGYALNGKYKVSTTVGSVTITEEEEVDFDQDEISRTDVGAQIGASLGLGLGSSLRVFVDGRYLLGFSNLDQHEHGSGDEPVVRNRGIALTAGLIFPF